MEQIAAAGGVSRGVLYDLFGNRQATLEALGLEQPSWRERILATGAELLAERGVAGLSLDQVAARSGASRATVYRLFAGKAALFVAIADAYLPVDDVLETMETVGDSPPEEVMPALAGRLARTGSVRIGVLRAAFFEIGMAERSEMARGEAGTDDVLAAAFQKLEVILRYLDEQMAAGRLRRMNPLLALQALLGPVLLHVVNRPLAEEHGLIDGSLDEAIAEFTAHWLRAMTPGAAPAAARPPSGAGATLRC
jgi:AcrR family transcriptional regulator